MEPKFAIIGAGIVGISSVAALIDSFSSDHELSRFTFDLYAEYFSPNTTSDVAAGLCYTHELGDTPKHLIALVYIHICLKVNISYYLKRFHIEIKQL